MKYSLETINHYAEMLEWERKRCTALAAVPGEATADHLKTAAEWQEIQACLLGLYAIAVRAEAEETNGTKPQNYAKTGATL